ncbi:MAG: type II secretion system ATPase GspE, partial [Rhodospirillaceae bacterium]|nr:type II secretion system ATPase GspE [Rhodospirillaceae bacterium]
ATRGQARPLALIEARRALGRPLQVERLPDSAFDRHLAERYAVTGLTAQSIETELARQDSLDDLVEGLPAAADLLEIEDEAPIIRLINGLIAEALKVKASDIHVEPFESRLSVRLRVDGLLREVVQLSPRTAPLLVSRIKVMARLDIAEKRLPQDGRISLTIGGRTLDLRVSTLPAQHGERVVMRLLDKSQDHLNIDALGMSPATASAYREALKQPNGVILVTGPTGSGKTTTLYAGLSLLNDQSRNILTIEDPIEYAIEGVGQTQVNARVGLTFAAGLRAILRQDPDVVMVGEIRDPETAQIAVQASLTGHLVLSTVHTNDAVSAITRLRDIGVEPFLLASTVKAIIAQRLVRRLCAHCRQPAAPELSALKVLGPRAAGVTRAWRAVGCPACKGQGYVGRIGLYELVVVGDEIKRLIHDDAPEHALHESACRAAATWTDAALAHVMAGTTTLEEALRVCRKVEVGDGDV